MVGVVDGYTDGWFSSILDPMDVCSLSVLILRSRTLSRHVE